MPRTCTVCRHAERELLDKELIEGHPLRSIAKQYGTSATALLRHRQSHLPRMMVEAREAQVVASGNDLLYQMQDLTARTLRILDQAERARDSKTALKAIGEVRRNHELLARLIGELETKKPSQIITDLDRQMIRAQVEATPPLVIQWIANNGRLPTAEERQKLLAAGDNAKADEPLEEG